MIVISDEEWDIKSLKNPEGELATVAEIHAAVIEAGYEVHSITVRPNHHKDLNEDEILDLTKSKDRYHKVYTNNFEAEVKEAFENILKQLSQ